MKIVKAIRLFTMFFVVAIISTLESWSSVVAQETSSVKTWVIGNREYRLNEKYFPKTAIEIVRIVESSADSFPEGFHIVLKNVSQKPIYFANFWLYFSPPGSTDQEYEQDRYDVKISYGPKRFITTTSPVDVNDISVKPGEEFQLEMDKQDLKGFLLFLKQQNEFVRTKILNRVILRPQFITFGDGTGCSLHECTSSFTTQ